MRINPFIDFLPTIDVHGYTSDTIFVPIDEFISDNLKMGKYKIVIIHGIGLGILKKEIARLFKRDKRIKNITGDPFNPGITIIELNK